MSTGLAFATLNPAQREAVMHGTSRPGGGLQAGPLLVIAGAGTGKTSTLAHRVAHLLLQGVPAERMLLLTFTRRAALEMTRRAQRVMTEALAAQAGTAHRVPDTLRLPWSGTFHAIGNRLIREYAVRLALDPGFSVLDRGDAADLMDVVRHRLGFSKTEKRFPRKETCPAFTRIASTRSSRCATRSKPSTRGASSGKSSSPRSAAPTSRRSSSSRCSITTTCCCTGT